MTIDASAVVFDPYDYAFQEDPYPVYRAAARRGAALPQRGARLLGRSPGTPTSSTAMRTDGVYSNAMGVSLDASAWTPDAHQVMSFLAMDPPRQTRLRKLVSKGFTPRGSPSSSRRSSGSPTTTSTRCLEAGRRFDWIGDFAGRLPMDVISEMMGVPEADRDEVRRLADLLVHREAGVRDVPPAGIEAAMTLFGYYADMVERAEAAADRRPHQRAARAPRTTATG